MIKSKKNTYSVPHSQKQCISFPQSDPLLGAHSPSLIKSFFRDDPHHFISNPLSKAQH